MSVVCNVQVTRQPGVLLLLILTALLAACGGDDDSTTPVPPTIDLTAVSRDFDSTPDLPDAAYRSDGGTVPHSTVYWAAWNSCAPDNRADEAAANGGREAGWFLVDDFLADPGIQLGDHRLASCDESLALLLAANPGLPVSEPNQALAGQLLAAELNLSTGAETCPIAEEATLGAHIVLADLRFEGDSVANLNPRAEVTEAIPELIDLLRDYNSGRLCR